MGDIFLSNASPTRFLDRLKDCFRRCESFDISVSFIKEAGLVLIASEIEAALARGVKGRILTSTYQNFTDVPSLRLFLSWIERYPNFSCHLDFECFGERGFHTKGYLFHLDSGVEFLVGSTNITRFALLKNVEWNVSLIRGENDPVLLSAQSEFSLLYEKTLPLSEDLIKRYAISLSYAIMKWDMDYDAHYEERQARPNAMQKPALRELQRYRDMGVKKALVVAATASGKTYLAAFDARNFEAKRLLFIVHRDTILAEAMKTFEKVFLSKRTYGIFQGKEEDHGVDFLFASNIMMATHLFEFDPEEFDYIIFDECHHATASTYRKIYDYFRPRFLLGLTATPERMDNEDVFEMFDRNVPYELRLRDAIKNDLVAPFSYFGVRDEFVDYSDKAKSSFLSRYFENGHMDYIVREIETHRLKGKLKAVAFCRSVEHASAMAHAFAECGYCSTAITGSARTGERLKAFTDLQDEDSPLEILCTVDILNEGVDIPGINMVLFLRPTESSTIFIQQLGRGLRKCEGKERLVVLDFIGNSYDRSVQIVSALGGLSATTYAEKALMRALVRDDFPIDLPGVDIHFDERSKEEVLAYIEKTNFNKESFLKQDYLNFKKFLLCDTFPKHVDYLHSDCAPDLMRFIKARLGGKKNGSYYNFLRAIGEDVPAFREEEIAYLVAASEQLPLTRKEEFLILSSLLEGHLDLQEIKESSPRITDKTLDSAIHNLEKQGLAVLEEGRPVLSLPEVRSFGFDSFLKDLLRYGLERYETEFGEFEGPFKLYGDYANDKIILEIDGTQTIFQRGTKYDVERHIAYLFVGIKKDMAQNPNFAYKDKFLSPRIFQWESKNNTLPDNAEGKKLLTTKTVHLFVRKVDEEDGITLPFTYFGTGHFERMRRGENAGTPTLVFDVVLDHEVPEEYRFDFLVPEEN